MRYLVLVDPDLKHRAVLAGQLRFAKIVSVGANGGSQSADLTLTRGSVQLLVAWMHYPAETPELVHDLRTYAEPSGLPFTGLTMGTAGNDSSLQDRSPAGFDFLVAKPVDINIIFSLHCLTVSNAV